MQTLHTRARNVLGLAKPSAVRLSIYDVLGREVAVLVDGALEAGRHEATFDGAALPAGVYLARLAVETEGGARQTFAHRLTVVR